jgi:uracil-DNA glycosylase family 4
MRGFFDKDQFSSPGYKSQKGILSCASCGLYKFAMSPRMKPYGKFEKQIMIIGEGPGEEEDRKGKPWQGKMGRALQRKYRQLGIDLFRDCVSLNAVNCRPVDGKGNNRSPTDHEIACCRQKVIAAIKEYQPKVIILQGGAAVSSLIGYRWRGRQNGIMTWRGWTIPDRELDAWVCPTFHPSYVERQEGESEVRVIWTRDLKRAFTKLEEPFPSYRDERECVTITHDADGVLRTILKEKPQYLAFDIETTGLKPYNKEDHQIVSISFCWDGEQAYAMPFPAEGKGLVLLKRVLVHSKIGKIAANMKYEDHWTNFLHGIEIQPWVFDTMQASHILDNRPGITGLKFQSYVRFGLLSYEEEVAPYLKSPSSNAPNKIMQLVRDRQLFNKLLLYNGIDSLMTYRLAKAQIKELGWIT